ncbi:hypothetical protein PPERSA_08353 [Pseudocohnilembus persalinus]|uniref:Uncharacterized protein n=1 Tax=Pseudocohnilembus persalinus TaxID=266149 RepID=A0A0V0QQ14_PSEPJ|nr:hypothetical protein PPERSA_08353 [Pseudocohnilembus persalinus]|eukprot:KRX04138.1 hypothetical protein PPERSA_08353 [Pseudocohnilembus persalinus]
MNLTLNKSGEYMYLKAFTELTQKQQQYQQQFQNNYYQKYITEFVQTQDNFIEKNIPLIEISDSEQNSQQTFSPSQFFETNEEPDYFQNCDSSTRNTSNAKSETNTIYKQQQQQQYQQIQQEQIQFQEPISNYSPQNTEKPKQKVQKFKEDFQTFSDIHMLTKSKKIHKKSVKNKNNNSNKENINPNQTTNQNKNNDYDNDNNNNNKITTQKKKKTLSEKIKERINNSQNKKQFQEDEYYHQQQLQQFYEKKYADFYAHQSYPIYIPEQNKMITQNYGLVNLNTANGQNKYKFLCFEDKELGIPAKLQIMTKATGGDNDKQSDDEQIKQAIKYNYAKIKQRLREMKQEEKQLQQQKSQSIV